MYPDKQMDASYRASLVNRHVRSFTGNMFQRNKSDSEKCPGRSGW